MVWRYFRYFGLRGWTGLLWCGLGTRCWMCFICVFVEIDLVDADLGGFWAARGIAGGFADCCVSLDWFV